MLLGAPKTRHALDGPAQRARDAGCPNGAIDEPACRSLTIHDRSMTANLTDE
jgi:hypothetical protein